MGQLRDCRKTALSWAELDQEQEKPSVVENGLERCTLVLGDSSAMALRAIAY